jgi:hypothetical protein
LIDGRNACLPARLAAQPLWPGFQPEKTPLEIFDGKNTYLLRHPAPPAEFKPLNGHPGFWVYAGKHSNVRANTSVELVGVWTATVEDSMDPAVLIHECFHAFERQKHPLWVANEAALFAYPVEDSQALALSRLELEAMSRALTAANPTCWSARVRAVRQRRFSLLPKDAVGYERGNELNEGLAQYVEGMASGRKDVKFRVFGPEEVRQRGYLSGEALARLLDRIDSDWKTKVNDGLDTLLPQTWDVDSACDFTQAETQSAESQAETYIAKLKDQRSEVMKAFESQPGWRVTVTAASGKPLMLAGFDPLNVSRLSAEAVLHKRWLKLQSDSGSLEIMFLSLRAWQINHSVGPEPGISLAATKEHMPFTGIGRSSSIR